LSLATTSAPSELERVLLSRLGRREGNEVRFRCPAHEDTHPSARWHPGKQTWFCDVCQIGGGWRDLAARLGVDITDQAATAGPSIVASYAYRDATGKLVYEVVRKSPKGFACRRPNEHSGWSWDLEGVERVLYRLPEVLAAVAAGEPVVIVEGEKDADAVAGLSLAATTNSGGAGRWRAEHSKTLRGASIIILPDNDKPGRAHAEAVARSLAGHAAAIRLLDLPGLPPKGDVSDWIAQGLAGGATRETLRAQLVDLALRAPLWQVSSPVLLIRRSLRLSEVAPERVDFLWYPYIPLRKLTILEGDPGQGKSWLTAALAAGGSLGVGLPGVRAVAPFRSLLFTAEDGLADTLRPRLDAMGADCSLIRGFDDPLSLSAPDDVATIENEIAESRALFVVLDPIVAFLGPRTDIYRANEVRALLAPLAKLAYRRGCGIVAVRHLNKAKVGRSIYAGQGSIDFTASARSVLLAGSAPDDPHQHALVHIKSNLAPCGSSCGYRIDDGRFCWTGESTLGACDLLAAEAPFGAANAEEEARAFLRATLSDGALPATAIRAAAREVGISERTLKRAKQREQVEVVRQGFGEGSLWLWRYPDRQHKHPSLCEGGQAKTWPPSPDSGPLRAPNGPDQELPTQQAQDQGTDTKDCLI
jgi:putative DNA primase/helicase